MGLIYARGLNGQGINGVYTGATTALKMHFVAVLIFFKSIRALFIKGCGANSFLLAQGLI